MHPKISDPLQLTLVGMSFYGDPFDSHSGWDEETQIGHLWKRFMRYLDQNPEIMLIFRQPGVAYEVHIYTDETNEKGLFEVFVGMEVDVQNIRNIPVELAVKTLPATSYALFTLTGQEINLDWEKILEEWLKTSGYHSPHAYNFQYYDERFKGVANLEGSVLDVYVPVEKAA